METKKVVSLVFGVLILLTLLFSAFRFGSSQASPFDFLNFGWLAFSLLILSLIFGVLGFELIRIGLKK